MAGRGVQPMTGFVKQWLWALFWLVAASALLLLGWKLNVPWLAAMALVGVLAPLTPTSWREDG